MRASSRSPCWPARRSCSTRSSSHPGDRSECPLRGPRAATFAHQHELTQVRHVRSARLSSGDP
jgi:hypothetical protein